MVVTFSKHLPYIPQILRKHQHLELGVPRLVFQAPPLLTFRRDSNICDVLVHGKTKKLVNSGEKNYCYCCVYQKISHNEVFNTADNESFRLVRFGKCAVFHILRKNEGIQTSLYKSQGVFIPLERKLKGYKPPNRA